jgi:hypothetical protein
MTVVTQQILVKNLPQQNLQVTQITVWLKTRSQEMEMLKQKSGADVDISVFTEFN